LDNCILYTTLAGKFETVPEVVAVGLPIPMSEQDVNTKIIEIATNTQKIFFISPPFTCIEAKSSSAEVGDERHYADDNEIDTNQIIENLGENHHNNTENETCDPHP
jgi:hypothetical protein